MAGRVVRIGLLVQRPHPSNLACSKRRVLARGDREKEAKNFLDFAPLMSIIDGRREKI